MDGIYYRGDDLSDLNKFHKINNIKLKKNFMNIQRIRDQQLDIVDPLKSIKSIFVVVLISQLYKFPFQMSKWALLGECMWVSDLFAVLMSKLANENLKLKLEISLHKYRVLLILLP